MAYILSGERDQDPSGSFQRYKEYLIQNHYRFPPSAYELAISAWYFNANDHRCPHDSWLESVTVSDLALDKNSEKRSTRISVRLLAAYHDGYIELEYPQVFSYSFDLVAATRGHGDWRYDELRLSKTGHVIHEIEWRNYMDFGV